MFKLWTLENVMQIVILLIVLQITTAQDGGFWWKNTGLKQPQRTKTDDRNAKTLVDDPYYEDVFGKNEKTNSNRNMDNELDCVEVEVEAEIPDFVFPDDDLLYGKQLPTVNKVKKCQPKVQKPNLNDPKSSTKHTPDRNIDTFDKIDKSSKAVGKNQNNEDNLYAHVFNGEPYKEPSYNVTYFQTLQDPKFLSSKSNVPENFDTIYSNPSQHDTIYSNPSEHDTIYSNPSQHDTIYSNPSQHDTIYSNPSQHDTIYSNPSQHDKIYSNPSQHDTIYSNPSQHDTIYSNPSQHDTIYSNPSQHDTIYSNPSQHDTIYSNPSQHDTNKYGEFYDDNYRLSPGFSKSNQDYGNPIYPSGTLKSHSNTHSSDYYNTFNYDIQPFASSYTNMNTQPNHYAGSGAYIQQKNPFIDPYNNHEGIYPESYSRRIRMDQQNSRDVYSDINVQHTGSVDIPSQSNPPDEQRKLVDYDSSADGNFTKEGENSRERNARQSSFDPSNIHHIPIPASRMPVSGYSDSKPTFTYPTNKQSHYIHHINPLSQPNGNDHHFFYNYPSNNGNGYQPARNSDDRQISSYGNDGHVHSYVYAQNNGRYAETQTQPLQEQPKRLMTTGVSEQPKMDTEYERQDPNDYHYSPHPVYNNYYDNTKISDTQRIPTNMEQPHDVHEIGYEHPRAGPHHHHPRFHHHHPCHHRYHNHPHGGRRYNCGNHRGHGYHSAHTPYYNPTQTSTNNTYQTGVQYGNTNQQKNIPEKIFVNITYSTPSGLHVNLTTNGKPRPINEAIGNFFNNLGITKTILQLTRNNFPNNNGTKITYNRDNEKRITAPSQERRPTYMNHGNNTRNVSNNHGVKNNQERNTLRPINKIQTERPYRSSTTERTVSTETTTKFQQPIRQPTIPITTMKSVQNINNENKDVPTNSFYNVNNEDEIFKTKVDSVEVKEDNMDNEYYNVFGINNANNPVKDEGTVDKGNEYYDVLGIDNKNDSVKTEDEFCRCVPYYDCNDTDDLINGNPRFDSCSIVTEVCCQFTINSTLEPANNYPSELPTLGVGPEPQVNTNDEDCVCVDYFLCEEGQVNTNGDKLIDLRFSGKNTTYIVDVTIPHDENLQKAERDKILKYMDLAHEIKDMWRTPATIVPIVISTNGLIPKNLHANLCKVGVDGGLKYLMQKAVLLSTCRTLRCEDYQVCCKLPKNNTGLPEVYETPKSTTERYKQRSTPQLIAVQTAKEHAVKNIERDVPDKGVMEAVNEDDDGCVCVPYYLCADGTINTDGTGLLDFRVSACPDVDEVCCKMPKKNLNVISNTKAALIQRTTTERQKADLTMLEDEGCSCVYDYMCADEKVKNYGVGILDLRFGGCPEDNQVCCNNIIS